MKPKIDLLSIQPHKVSRDLSGYITYIYGAAKTGKTTLASQMDGALLLAFERGYNAIPGIIAQDVTTWGEMKQIVRQLKTDEVKSAYKCIIIDTVDIAAAACEKYICGQLGIENIGDGGWSVNGWAKVKKEFEETFRTISQQGYALFFISHAKDKTFKRADGTEYNQIVPSLSTAYNEIVKNMADIFGYSHSVTTEDGRTTVALTLRSLDNSIDTGCRFKYIEPVIEFNYKSLVKAINDAIDKEAVQTDNKYITDERNTFTIEQELDFPTVMKEFEETITTLTKGKTEDEITNIIGPQITTITEKYLGKGKKASQCTKDQVEQLNLIVVELQDLMK